MIGMSAAIMNGNKPLQLMQKKSPPHFLPFNRLILRSAFPIDRSANGKTRDKNKNEIHHEYFD